MLANDAPVLQGHDALANFFAAGLKMGIAEVIHESVEVSLVNSSTGPFITSCIVNHRDSI